MKTIIEAGHYYKVDGPSVLSIKGWEIGKEIATNQPDTKLALFVDDYHQSQDYLEPGDGFLDPEQAESITVQMQQEADYTFSEAAIAQEAPQTMNGLLDASLVKLKKGVLSVAGVRLGWLRRLRYRLI